MVQEQSLTLPPGTSVLEALRLADLQRRFPEFDLTQLAISIWGRQCAVEQLLVDGDRVELCRGLLVDPKMARRERFARQGSRGTGLFAKRKPGAQAGY
jgi:putative ubiquitin-RnfH superfamily antitoxin RatB of RatAB toxin-antitoxin module